MQQLAVSILIGLGAAGCVFLVTHAVYGRMTSALVASIAVTLLVVLVRGIADRVAHGGKPPKNPGEGEQGKGDTFDDSYP